MSKGGKYFDELLLEIGPRADPGGDRVAEEDEVMHDAARVDSDHVAHTAEGRVLLLVVPNVAQRHTPVSPQLRERREQL